MSLPKPCLGCKNLTDDTRVVVCAVCRQASCWQGVFLCQAADNSCTAELSVGELRELALENPEYWHIDPETGVSAHVFL